MYISVMSDRESFSVVHTTLERGGLAMPQNVYYLIQLNIVTWSFTITVLITTLQESPFQHLVELWTKLYSPESVC